MAEILPITPVILSGGAGTRLWPMSRESFPKQLLPLASDQSMLQQTAARVELATQFNPPMVICNAAHRFIVAEQLRAVDVEPRAIVLEPVGRNTAPAAAIAALMLVVDDPNALILLLPSDHIIAKTDAFHKAVQIAAGAAAGGAMVAFGIKPERAETGYGYIHRGSAMTEHPGIYQIAEFVEKPDAATAKKYLSGGVHDWNSGMFLFSAAAYIKELERLEPEIISQCQAAIDAAATDLDFIRLDPVAFAAAPSKSIDYAVMEHTDKAAVVPAEMGWNDVGSWTALWEIGTQDSSENVLLGNVIVLDSSRSYVRSEGPLVAALGIEDLVVVATPDAVLVLPRDRAQDVKTIVDELKSRGRDEAIAHPRVYRPWGFYQTLHDGERFQVKRITVNQVASLSLQMHHHRAEHWIAVNGAALVRNGNEEFTLKENELTYIPPTTLRRLSNPGKVPLNLIEVQSGSYLGEDDIVRYEDDYGRG
jgi:mannose-1-phosphate guanylyltransferase/mannose-1-phosphate guanylyltransferase/mannose-6-phosphate isomerase